MLAPLVLASASEVRATLLRAAGLTVEIAPARIDEATIKAALEHEGAPPRDIADALAEAKARRVAARVPGALVLGADQVLDLEGKILSKPASQENAMDQLRHLSGKRHRLLSALVVVQAGQPVWRHVAEVRLTMHPLSDQFISDYVKRNWHRIQYAVGCYKLEEEGVRLFSAVEGDYFSVLGLPLIPFLNWLRARGELMT